METDGVTASSVKTRRPVVSDNPLAATVQLRSARPEDADEAAAVIAASIRDLCRADHGDDPAVLSAWLANKTPEGMASMIADPRATVWVALCDDRIAAVGQTTAEGHAEGAGKITLNYVAPGYRKSGISTALLAHMEAALAGQGVGIARLTSTFTARAFYLARGWSPAAAPRRGRWIEGHPMEKHLSRDIPGA